MALQIGSSAPDFTLLNTRKEPVALDSLKGRKEHDRVHSVSVHRRVYR